MFRAAVTTLSRAVKDLGCHWILRSPGHSGSFSPASIGKLGGDVKL